MRHSFIIDPANILRERLIQVRPAIHGTEVLSRLEELQQSFEAASLIPQRPT